MIFSVRKWMTRLKYIVIFIVLTYTMYQIIEAVSSWMEPTHRYNHPSGNAVKAFQQEPYAFGERGTPLERLIYFYWFGE